MYFICVIFDKLLIDPDQHLYHHYKKMACSSQTHMLVTVVCPSGSSCEKYKESIQYCGRMLTNAHLQNLVILFIKL